MFTKKILLPTMTFVILSNMGVANADTNGLIFPPAESQNIYQYPPQNIPSMGAVPNYAFGQPNIPQTIPNQAYMNRSPYPSAQIQRQRIPIQNMQPPYPSSAGNKNQKFPFANNMMPFGNNRSNSFNPFANSNMPFGNNSSNGFNPFSGNSTNNPFNSMFGNNRSLPFFGNSNNSKRKKAWGTERNIWPDFYTDFTDEAWDTMTGGPRDLGKMPGGWRFPYISTPDPVTVSDAITNQFPPIMEEGGNMMDFSDWGIFD